MSKDSDCRICAWFRSWADVEGDCDFDSLWEKTYQWEYDQPDQFELWKQELDFNLLQEADRTFASNPATALAVYRSLAERGSTFAMEKLAYCYRIGDGVEADANEALEWYRLAICAGSWLATLRYAYLLASQQRLQECEQVLADGVEAGYAPAFFWLAWYRLQQSQSRATYHEIKPLLEHAARQDHPMAEFLFAKHMVRGKFGIQNVPRGLLLVVRWSIKMARSDKGPLVHDDDAKEMSAETPPAARAF